MASLILSNPNVPRSAGIQDAVLLNGTPKRGYRYNDNEVFRGEYWYGIIHKGTVVGLTKTGIVTPDMLPPTGERSITHPWHDGKMVITKQTERVFQVLTHFSESEAARRREAEWAAAQLNKAQKEESRRLDDMPKSHDDFRRHMLAVARLTIGNLKLYAENDGAGFNFNREAWEEIDEALNDVINVIRHGGTSFNRQVRQAKIATIKATTSKANAPLQNFLGSLMAASHPDIYLNGETTKEGDNEV